MKFTITSKIKTLGLIALLAISLVSCNQPKNKTPPFDLEKAKSEIRSRLNLYEQAMKRGDKDALGNMYAENAEIFQDGKANTIGRESITKVFEGWARDSIIGSFKTTGLWGNEDLLIEQGTGYFAQANSNWKSTGKYLLVWKKVDGEWQIFRDTWFSDPKKEDE
jgi:ketosteroid isomerase-like protein